MQGGGAYDKSKYTHVLFRLHAYTIGEIASGIFVIYLTTKLGTRLG